MPGHLPAVIVTERAARLRSIASRKKATFLKRFEGTELRVLVQGFDEKTGICRGLSRNYINVSFSGRKEMVNEEVSVLINSFDGDICMGSYAPTV